MPQKLGRYEIVEEIGKGAMGVVYLARDPLIGRLVALKTFRVGFSARDEEVAQFRSRFVREAQSAGILSHPNIVTVHDVVDEGTGGTCFIAMEYVKGTNLKQLLQRPDPFPLGFVVEVLSQVAEGLDYAHSRGVVHRDIKPANILITPDNRVKITDFGIARIDSSNLTMEGQLLGTPNYMAPEQIQGREVDHRADVFSLGVVFYEMLTRRKPFQGENLTAVTHKIVYDSFIPPEEIVRDLPRAFTEILSRCLEKDANRRYPRASEVARELRAVLQAQQALDDTVATQEVEPLLSEAPDPAAEAAPAGAAAAPAPAPPPPPSEEVVPTRLMERPPLPPAPPPADAVGENAPTRLVARPVLPEAPRARLVAAPPPPRTEEPAAPSAPPKPPAPATGTAKPGIAGSVASTVLSSVPRGSDRPLGEVPSAVAPSPPSSKARAWFESVTTGKYRVVAVGVAALAAFGLAALAAIVLRGGDEAPAVAEQPAPAPSFEQQSRVTAATALAEARSQLAQGNLDGALQAVARAELAEPQSPETVALREEIAARQLELAEAEIHARTEQALRTARYAFAERRYAEAISAAKGVLEIRRDNEEAKRILAESEGAVRRMRERQNAIDAAQREAAAAAAAAAESPAVEPAREVAPAKDAGLRIAFASDRSEGVLTVYAADRQILREPFRFIRRTGFLAREKVSGTIEANRRLGPGPVALRVYVALEGETTRTISLDADFVAGATYVLEIRVDADGNATAIVR